MTDRFHRLLLALPALLCIAAGDAQAITFQGNGSASTWYRNHGGLHPPNITYCEGAPCTAVNSHYASASLQATMSPGTIAVDIAATGWGDGWGQVGYRGVFSDRFTLYSSTLAPGTPVNVRYIVDIDLTASGGAGTTPHFTVSFGPFPDCCHAVFQSWNKNSPAVPGQLQGVLQALVGHEHSIAGQLVVGAGQDYREPGTATVNGSVNFYLDVLDPGATLVAASGHAYRLATPVPEPGTWAMMLAGTALLAAVARGRRRR